MQKIIINNFGAVKNAEIDIKKVLILIGEQASGKSTIAKLIYFFRSLRDDLSALVFSNDKKGNFDEESDFLKPLCARFYNLFGSTYNLPNFEITFYYSAENDKYIRLTLNEKKELNAKLSNDFFNHEFKNDINELRLRLQLLEKEQDAAEKIFNNKARIGLIRKLYYSVNKLLQIQQEDNVFIVAGRTATVSYSDLFEKHLFSSIENKLENNKIQPFITKVPTIDLELMIQFIKHVSSLKNSMESIQASVEQGIVHGHYWENYSIIKKQIQLILKGNYIIDDSGERIIFGKEGNSKEYIYLSNSSSGQQEVVRILQDILWTVLYQRKTSRIIEEPEAHLFPIAQKQLVELFALMVNQDIDNQLIITTHSPYILAAFNNLLFAKRVIEKNPNAEKEVSEIVGPEFRLESNEFAAYSLTHNENEDYCTSIMSERGLITENYLDTVSDVLSNDFNVLYNIHAQTFARK